MPTIMYRVGIDPGLSGAYCVIDSNQSVVICDNLPIVNGWIDYNACLETYNSILSDLNVYRVNLYIGIEKPFILSSQKGNEKIWRNYQTLYLAFKPDIEIRPQEWKKALRIPKGLNKKDSVKYQVENICPDYDWSKTLKSGNKSKVIDDGKVDSYCIALTMPKTKTI